MTDEKTKRVCKIGWEIISHHTGLAPKRFRKLASGSDRVTTSNNQHFILIPLEDVKLEEEWDMLCLNWYQDKETFDSILLLHSEYSPKFLPLGAKDSLNTLISIRDQLQKL